MQNRKSNRLEGYDYSQSGAYFITICTYNKVCRLGSIIKSKSFDFQSSPELQEHEFKMELNEFGQIAYEEWGLIPKRFSNCELDVFQLMPNHLHGIILLKDIDNCKVDKENNLTINLIDELNMERAEVNPAPTVGDIICAYKSIVYKRCLEISKGKNIKLGKLWQRNYYDHIIRSENSFNKISSYIINNPFYWEKDRFFSL